MENPNLKSIFSWDLLGMLTLANQLSQSVGSMSDNLRNEVLQNGDLRQLTKNFCFKMSILGICYLVKTCMTAA